MTVFLLTVALINERYCRRSVLSTVFLLTVSLITECCCLYCSGSIDCVCFIDDNHFLSGADDRYKSFEMLVDC